MTKDFEDAAFAAHMAASEALGDGERVGSLLEVGRALSIAWGDALGLLMAAGQPAEVIAGLGDLARARAVEMAGEIVVMGGAASFEARHGRVQ